MNRSDCTRRRIRRLPSVLAPVLLVAALLLTPGVQALQAPRTGSTLALAASQPRLRVQPGVVAQGGRVAFIGTNFRRSEGVRLYVGPPQSEAEFIGSTRTDRHGSFRKSFTVSRTAHRGRYVVLACQRACRIKISARFRIS